MPVLKLHFPKELVDPENFEDLLLEVNKEIPEEGNKFKSREDWMRSLLRNYAVASINSYQRWVATKYLPTTTRPIQVPELDLWEGDPEGLDDGNEGELVSLTIGELQYKYLKTATMWENTYQREIVKSVIEHKNVACLARFILLNSLLQVQAKVDEEKLKEEEQEILKEEKT